MDRIKKKIFVVIFGTDTPAGKLFDVVLLWLILISVIAVVLESVDSIRENYGEVLKITEWIVTVAFSLEYFARIYSSPDRKKYIFSFYGVIDLVALVPTYISLILTGTHFLIILRSVRLLRIFRIFKLSRYLKEAEVLGVALTKGLYKITVFFGVVLTLVMILGTLMYIIEGPENGFKNIPESIYWSIVTITTVGYGDIAPQTVIGKTLASVIMLLGYSIIAIPTGIVSSEITRASQIVRSHKICKNCSNEENDENAKYCKECGNKL